MLNNASKERSVSFMTEKSQTEIIALGEDMANFSFQEAMANHTSTPSDDPTALHKSTSSRNSKNSKGKKKPKLSIETKPSSLGKSQLNPKTNEKSFKNSPVPSDKGQKKTTKMGRIESMTQYFKSNAAKNKARKAGSLHQSQ